MQPLNNIIREAQASAQAGLPVELLSNFPWLKTGEEWSDLQLAFNRAANATLMRDHRLTDWERGFMGDQMDRARDKGFPPHVSEKQAAIIQEIAAKVPDVPAL